MAPLFYFEVSLLFHAVCYNSYKFLRDCIKPLEILGIRYFSHFCYASLSKYADLLHVVLLEYNATSDK